MTRSALVVCLLLEYEASANYHFTVSRENKRLTHFWQLHFFGEKNKAIFRFRAVFADSQPCNYGYFTFL